MSSAIPRCHEQGRDADEDGCETDDQVYDCVSGQRCVEVFSHRWVHVPMEGAETGLSWVDWDWREGKAKLKVRFSIGDGKDVKLGTLVVKILVGSEAEVCYRYTPFF
jgi:hypothetical protein